MNTRERPTIKYTPNAISQSSDTSISRNLPPPAYRQSPTNLKKASDSSLKYVFVGGIVLLVVLSVAGVAQLFLDELSPSTIDSKGYGTPEETIPPLYTTPTTLSTQPKITYAGSKAGTLSPYSGGSGQVASNPQPPDYVAPRFHQASSAPVVPTPTETIMGSTVVYVTSNPGDKSKPQAVTSVPTTLPIQSPEITVIPVADRGSPTQMSPPTTTASLKRNLPSSAPAIPLDSNGNPLYEFTIHRTRFRPTCPATDSLKYTAPNGYGWVILDISFRQGVKDGFEFDPHRIILVDEYGGIYDHWPYYGSNTVTLRIGEYGDDQLVFEVPLSHNENTRYSLRVENIQTIPSTITTIITLPPTIITQPSTFIEGAHKVNLISWKYGKSPFPGDHPSNEYSRFVLIDFEVQNINYNNGLFVSPDNVVLVNEMGIPYHCFRSAKYSPEGLVFRRGVPLGLSLRGELFFEVNASTPGPKYRELRLEN